MQARVRRVRSPPGPLRPAETRHPERWRWLPSHRDGRPFLKGLGGSGGRRAGGVGGFPSFGWGRFGLILSQRRASGEGKGACVTGNWKGRAGTRCCYTTSRIASSAVAFGAHSPSFHFIPRGFPPLQPHSPRFPHSR